ncbi:carbonic anhydrase [Actinoplanes teichomyceticus]|uniref:Carbonic anhydrase n=1 Tax=Actinoplanes teichomyceticus TaxID=1867 RepID=A0A561WIE2_ACTTI|nr:carbonic anhydrase [Actinoplanes teichomyceticus]TWG23649.1 carbonic anhydrase [Actinoplanes teichomyceticus]GIF11687.1 carbonic anhydrase [Actinoplanes teichomyceticus]
MTAIRAAQAITPGTALGELITGNKRFVYGKPRYGHNVTQAAATAGGQQPHAVVLGCIDSRVPLEAIFDQAFGSICVARSGAHVLDRSILGSVEFAVSALGVSLVLVVGHKRCGAVTATVDAVRSGDRPAGDVGYLVGELAPAVDGIDLTDPEAAEQAVRAHVLRTVERLRESAGLAPAIAAGRIDVVGGIYDLDTGWVEFLKSA